MCPGVLFVGPVSRCPGVTNCVLKYCLPVSRCPGVLFVGPLVHANQTSRFRRLLRGSAEGLVWLGGGSLLGELPQLRRLLAAAPAADVEVLPRCLHACPWGTGRERGGVGEGKGRGRARGRERGLRFPRLLGSRPRVGVAWNDSIVDPFIYSFMNSFIHLCIRSFIQSAKRDTNRDTRGVQPGDQPGDQPGHQPWHRGNRGTPAGARDTSWDTGQLSTNSA